jgi:hypothetical protein
MANDILEWRWLDALEEAKEEEMLARAAGGGALHARARCVEMRGGSDLIDIDIGDVQH